MIEIKRHADYGGELLCTVDADTLVGADLSGKGLWGADLPGADLRHANLRGTDLTGANLAGANLQEADLAGAILMSAYLQGAKLQSTILRGADLAGTDLRGSDLRRADLRGANMVGCRRFMSEADLSAAILNGVQVDWRSYELVGEILWQAADTPDRQMLAAFFARVEWTWEAWAEFDHPEMDWAIGELTYWATPENPVPDLQKIRDHLQYSRELHERFAPPSTEIVGQTG